jgi:hypothetical protein
MHDIRQLEAAALSDSSAPNPQSNPGNISPATITLEIKGPAGRCPPDIIPATIRRFEARAVMAGQLGCLPNQPANQYSYYTKTSR